LSELFGIDVTVPVAVEDLKGFSDLLRLVEVATLLDHHLQELVKVDGSIAVHVKFDDLKSRVINTILFNSVLR